MKDCSPALKVQRQQADRLQRQYQSFVKNKWAAPFADARNTRKKSILVKDASFRLNRPLYMRPDQQLSNSIIHAIDLIPNSVIASRDGVDMPSTYNQGYLCIVNDCAEVIITIPLQDLNSNACGKKLQGFYVKKPVWNECYLLLTGGALTQANGILMDVYFTPVK
jgi:hypothetical protein